MRLAAGLALGLVLAAAPDLTQGKVFYVQRGASQLTRIDGALATNAEGWFVAYLHGEPTDLIVKAAGHVPQTIRVAATPTSRRR